MVIIETSVFTRQVVDLLTDDEYLELQRTLSDRPATGDVIPRTGGLRKLRWGVAGPGKRGGVRIIYYWARQQEQILMLLLYPKNVQDDLTEDQRKILRSIVEEEYP